MNFLLVSAFAEDGQESGANRLRKLRFGLEELGHECAWLGPVSGFISRGAGKKMLTTWRLLEGIWRWSRNHRDGFVLISLPPPWLLPAAFLISYFLPQRLLVDFRDPILNQRINSRGRLYRFILRNLEAGVILRARLVILAAERIKDHLSVTNRKTVTVLAGLDDREVAEWSSKNLPRNRRKVIYGGTFYGSRSPLALLEAIAAESTNLVFEFYVSFNDGAEELAVTSQIRALGLAEKVRLYPQVPRPRFMEVLRGAGAGLVITHSEGSDYAIPGKIFDYITAGVLPWVISRDPGLLEFLEANKVSALVSDAWKKENLLAGLRRLEEMLAKQGSEAVSHERLSAKFQAELLVDALRER